MNRNQDLVSIAVNSHRIIVILVLINGRCELNVDFLSYASRDHALLLVPDFEITGLRGQDVKTLWRRRIIDQSKFHSVRFICLEPGKLDDAGRSAEDSIGSYSVIHVLLGDTQPFVCLSLCNHTSLNLDLILVGRGLAANALFKLFPVLGEHFAANACG